MRFIAFRKTRDEIFDPYLFTGDVRIFLNIFRHLRDIEYKDFIWMQFVLIINRAWDMCQDIVTRMCQDIGYSGGLFLKVIFGFQG